MNELPTPASEIWKRISAPQGLRLGDLAILRGKLKAADLERALAEQKRHAVPLGRILVEQGMLTTPTLAELLLAQERLCPAVRLCRMDRFVLLHELGHGGMSVVWRAWDPQLNRAVALKVTQVKSGDNRAMMLREVRAGAHLSHPNIVPIHEVAENDVAPYIVMGLVEGQTSAAAAPSLPVRSILQSLRDAARAVHYAHTKGIVHRDLKPHNLMIDREGKTFVMDFGLAKVVEPGSDPSITVGVIGTPAFMAPEQALGERVDARSDVFGLGATAYALLCGEPPFDGSTLAQVIMRVVVSDPLPLRKRRPELSSDVETIVHKAMAKDPAQRYPSAAALADDLDRYLRGEEIIARPAPRFRKLLRRHWRKGVSVAAGIALIAAATWVVREVRKNRAQERARAHLEEARAALAEADRFLFRETSDLQPMWDHLSAAMRKVEEARAEAPDFAEVHFLRGQILEMEGDPSADAEYTRALELDPRYGPCRLRRARHRLSREITRLECLERIGPEVYAFGRTEELAADFERAAESELDRLYARAVSRIARREFVQAERDLAGAPEREDLLQLHAYVLFRLERLDEAIRRLERAVELKYYDAVARLRLVQLLLLNGHFESASSHLEIAAAVLPRSPEILGLRGLVWIGLERYDEVLALLNGTPESGEIAYTRARCYQAMGRLEEALTEYGRAIDFFHAAGAPLSEAMARTSRAELYIELLRFPSCIDECDQAERLAPGMPTIPLVRGKLFARENDYPRALQEFERAAQSGAVLAAVWHEIGEKRCSLKDHAAAIQDFTRAIERAPTQAWYYRTRGLCRAHQKEPEEARRDLDRAVELDPKDGRIRLTRGEVFSLQEDLDEAVRLLPGLVRAYVARAALTAKRGDWEAVERDAVRALAITGREQRVFLRRRSYGLRALARVRLGKAEQELRELEEGVRADDADYPVRFALAQFVEGQDPRRARTEYLRIAQMVPDWTEVWGPLIQVRLRLGESKEALEDLERAVREKPAMGEFLKPLIEEVQRRSSNP